MAEPENTGPVHLPSPSRAGPRVALVHDWLTGMRGGERCLEAFCELLPGADLFTLVHVRGSVSRAIEDRPIHASFVDRLPFARKKYRTFLPLFPFAIESFDLSRFDVVVSLSHCVAKGVIPRPDARHVCYCFTPMRYVWDMYPHYFPPQRLNVLTRRIVPAVATWLRAWDSASASRADRIVAISEHVKKRVRKYWGREADVIYPPVDLSRFEPSKDRGDFFLMVSAFAPYKRVDLALEAFRRLGRPLKIVGTGQDERRLRAAAPSNVEFLGWQSDADVAKLYARCRAFVFPGEEDFGITPLEAQAAGRPVIALARGGAVETIVPHPDFLALPGSRAAAPPTGVLYPHESADSLFEALRWFEAHEKAFDDPSPLQANAARFSLERFRAEIRRLLASEGALPG
jgi:glycosyltransferase involved in cell wall biosynthesis